MIFNLKTGSHGGQVGYIHPGSQGSTPAWGNSHIDRTLSLSLMNPRWTLKFSKNNERQFFFLYLTVVVKENSFYN